MKLTKEFLNKHHACPIGIRFCERNKLLGCDLDYINDVVGDYDKFMGWIRGLVKSDKVYDKNGRLLSKTDPETGVVVHYEYNAEGQKSCMRIGDDEIRTYLYNDDKSIMCETHVLESESGATRKFILYNDNGLKHYVEVYKVVDDEHIPETIERFIYDSDGLLIKMITLNVKTMDYHETNFVNDSHGNMVKIIRHNGSEINFSNHYYDDGQLKEIFRGNTKILSLPFVS